MTRYIRPILSLDPSQPPHAITLAGGWSWFTSVEYLSLSAVPITAPVSELTNEERLALESPRADIARLRFDTPKIMGILNVTPDSFSDGGHHIGVSDAVARAEEMRAEGAALIDIGGESTRPGAEEVAVAQEIERVAPVIAALSADFIISLDTRKSMVAAAGLAAGAHIINDVSGLRFDQDLANVTARSGAALMLMHSIGTPKTMQAEAETAYTDVLLDIYDALAAAIVQAEAAGIPRSQIVIDPGIGFGKTQAQTLALLQRLALFHSLGCPVLLGVSRKGFIGAISGETDAAKRGPGSAGIGLWAVSQGVQILRVHDIAMHAQALTLWRSAHMGRV